MLTKHLLCVFITASLSRGFTLPTDWKTRIDKSVLEEGQANNRLLFNADDIIWDEEVSGSQNTEVLRTGHLAEYNYWPKEKPIPYRIQQEYSIWDRRKIEAAMRFIENETKCLQFQRQTREGEYIHFRVGRYSSQCEAQIGRHPGSLTTVFMGTGCLASQGTIIHEILHALGMFHEQSRPDRDDYVEIYAENIEPRALHNFAVLRNMSMYGTQYDVESIMHYHPFEFKKKGSNQPTILPKLGENKKMGQRQTLTHLDVAKLKQAYCSWSVPEQPILDNMIQRPSSGQNQSYAIQANLPTRILISTTPLPVTEATTGIIQGSSSTNQLQMQEEPIALPLMIATASSSQSSTFRSTSRSVRRKTSLRSLRQRLGVLFGSS
ncbi:hatching enzyme 1.2-like [Paramacrobiotus metropolitanus]|uniref:hatching enzyme 1.2-like n=1 Tax=Paramacrobiotus metropolitanus TaxID=2943436 RepID=UPI002445FF1E|nr:hatching enzyme 1.2-like [Paramacrobiotus metropolitanus]